MKAIWKDRIIAESNQTIELEGYRYFPKDAVNQEYLRESETPYHCPWKGDALFYDIIMDGTVHKDAAWEYPVPKEKASFIKDHIAFWKGVKVER
ncbi:MAG: DUF427 domain-containing protein [Cytophagaceae bacterium]